jgi:hypothetical protein
MRRATIASAHYRVPAQRRSFGRANVNQLPGRDSSHGIAEVITEHP